jgi:hypothetical protein
VQWMPLKPPFPNVIVFPASLYPLPLNVIELIAIPAARSFVVLWIVELAGKTRSSPGLGAVPPAQFAPTLQFPLTGVALQVTVAA